MDVASPHRSLIPSLDGDVLLVLARTEAPLTGRHITRLVEHASQPGVQRVLDRLVEQGLVSRESAGRAHLYELNRDHVAAPLVLALAQLRSELLTRLRGELSSWDPAPIHASLFGSAATQTGTTESDLDILLVRPGKVDAADPRWQEQVARLGELGHRWTGNHVQLFEVDEAESKELARARAEVIENAREEGVELAGIPLGRLLKRTR